MPNPERLKALRENELVLLDISARELIPMLMKSTDLKHVRQHAFSYYDKARKEELQVHVLVTRDESDFLEPFQTEEMS